jgi:hypothetical protein
MLWLDAHLRLLRKKILVFVNGSPTQEINIQRGLKQLDALSPFFFLLVAEGMIMSIKKVDYLIYFFFWGFILVTQASLCLTFSNGHGLIGFLA